MNSLSVSGRSWVLKTYNHEQVIFLKEDFSLNEMTSKLLSIRKIKKEDIKSFLNPSIKNILPNPNNLIDMEKATQRTLVAVNNKEKIGIFFDYDVDGATSTALLNRYFQLIKQNIFTYIPDRKKEGYGPSVDGFNNLIKSGAKIIFTVDCGTLSFEPVKTAQNQNVDVIVLDHHQSDIKIPNACAVVNPNRHDDTSELNYLCAAGVCFMFLVALNKKLRDENWFKENKINEPNILDFLDLVSLGTVCDVVPKLDLFFITLRPCLTIALFKPTKGTTSHTVPNETKSKKSKILGSLILFSLNQFSSRNFLFKATKNIKHTPAAQR
jgi:single-stranded-DNA-specific exonuclease